MTRLIDADALREKMFHEAFEKDSQDQKWDSGCWIRYHMFENAIDSIPTADVVEMKKEGEWEMFDLISSAYYGKGMYFKQDDGIVYSRYSCKYMSVDEAILEFVSLIDGTEEDDGRDKIT